MGSSEKAPRSERKRRLLMSGISSNVLALGIVSLLTDMSSEMIYPVLPLFLVAIGATGTMVGLIEGAAESTASFLKVVSGWYSDRFHLRKPFILGGYGTSAVVKPALYFATSPWHVLGIRITERIGKGVRSAPRDALIADSTDAGVRGKAYGFHKAMDSTGAVVGPVAALAILAYAAGAALTDVESYRLVFLLAPVPAFAAVIVILAFVKEKKGAPATGRWSFVGEMRHLGRPFWLLMVPVIAFYIGEISYAFFILRAEYAGYSSVATIGLYILFNIVFVVTSMPAGILSDRLGRKPIVMAAFALFALTSVIMASGSTLPLLVAGFALFGLYKGASEGVLKAYVIDVVPGHLRGTALGAFHTSVGLVMLPGGVVAGLLWDIVDPWATFAYGGMTAIIAIALLFALGPKRGVKFSSA